MSLVGSIIRGFMERRAGRQSFDEICQGLTISGEKITGLIRNSPNTSENREQASHLIGIERWSDHRLETVLASATPVRDEYDSYRPSPDLAMSALADEFQRTRSETLVLCEKLRPYADKRVFHNDFGEITVKTWLVYIQSHAARECKSIK
jgi:hypothetical protein